MKRLALVVLSVVALASICVARGRTHNPVTASKWDGWVSDEKCAAKGADPSHASCAVKCVAGGSAIVFITGKDKTIYKVDNQDSLKDLVGQYVSVTGTLTGDTIHVDKATKLKQPNASGEKGEHGSGD